MSTHPSHKSLTTLVPLSNSLPLAAIGRALVGILFLVSGVLKVGKFAALAGVLGGKGIPLPDLVLALTIGLKIGGGSALIVGWRDREAAIGLALFTVLATGLFHAFWMADVATYSNQVNHFLKNVAIVGALLAIVGTDRHRAEETKVLAPTEN